MVVLMDDLIAFSDDGSAVISRQLSSYSSSTETRKDLRHYYEIERCVEFITRDQSHQKVWVCRSTYVHLSSILVLQLVWYYIYMETERGYDLWLHWTL